MSEFGGLFKEFLDGITEQKKEETPEGFYKSSLGTEEQQKRDRKITELLGLYVSYYKDKTENNRKFRKTIFRFCIGVLGTYTLFLIVAGFLVLTRGSEAGHVIAFITASVTYVLAVIGLVKIITEHIFPQDDEKYITEIVQAIQNNDLGTQKLHMEHEEMCYKQELEQNGDKKE